MLFGYQFQVLPESTPAVLQQLNDAICYQTGHMHPHGLSREDISWVYHLGRFKTAAHLVGPSATAPYCYTPVVLDALHMLTWGCQAVPAIARHVPACRHFMKDAANQQIIHMTFWLDCRFLNRL